MPSPSKSLTAAGRYQVPTRGSAAVRCLEAAWELLRMLEPTIPPAVLTFVDRRSRRRVAGYFAHSAWQTRRGAAHETAISPQLMAQPEELLATMLHEASHAILFASGRHGGIGSTPYYHTRHFRNQCQALGLDCGFLDTRHGWARTAWPDQTVPIRYREIVRYLRQHLLAGTGRSQWLPRPHREPPLSGHTRLVCGCPDGLRSISVKKSVLKAGGIFCSFCQQEFRIAKPATD